MSNTISIRSLGRQYGYDESTIRQSWIPKGLDMSWPEEQIRAWVVDEVLKPLRDTDLNEQIARERLRRMAAEASQAELELDKQLSLVVDTAYLESSLSEFFSQMKNYLRTIPQKHYLELFESEDALQLKTKLAGFIDEVLNEIGNQEYEMPEEENEQGQVNENTEQGSSEDPTA
ncbi:terminase small subunit [Pantoea sp. SJZ147]|uniref:terminase small subunit n=1 Tax=Pantoea sp. SJZ147 TaxID=2572896 RepID=UPI0011A36B8B|nr:terminase small subunit [Pantoea sp. SJZ147]TWD31571.1 DNA packaging protein Nu1 [Pantoea sp. SJZ147]